jgi:hypothetical protein
MFEFRPRLVRISDLRQTVGKPLTSMWLMQAEDVKPGYREDPEEVKVCIRLCLPAFVGGSMKLDLTPTCLHRNGRRKPRKN